MTVFHVGSSAALHLLSHSVQALDKTLDFGAATNTRKKQEKQLYFSAWVKRKPRKCQSEAFSSGAGWGENTGSYLVLAVRARILMAGASESCRR